MSSCINDDLSQCPPATVEIAVQYSMHLDLQLSLSLQQHIDSLSNPLLYDALKEHLSTFLTDYAHDVDLHFYDYSTNQSTHHENHIIDSNEAGIAINLKPDNYYHTAVANIGSSSGLCLIDTAYAPTAQLGYSTYQMSQPQRQLKAAGRQTNSIFTAREPLFIQQSTSQHFDISLYMANCVVVLIADTTGSNTKQIEAEVEQTASAFMLQDSIYLFDHSEPQSMQPFVSPAPYTTLSAITFPSEDKTDSWQIKVNTYNSKGEQACSVLTMQQPLKAGELRIVRMQVGEKGAIEVGNTDVSVSVTLEWKTAGEHEIEI